MSEPRRIAIASPMTGEEEWLALREPLMNGWLTQGPKVAAFERRFAELHGVEHAIATTSCTTALHLALLATGVGPGDEVIVPAFTWVSTANVVLYCGAEPVFADIDPATFNLRVDDVRRRLSPRTKAVLPVHLFGLCVDVLALRAALPAEVRVVEDAACAAGARLGNRSAGGLGEIAAFSFHPRKSVTTGEGGMITTNHAATAALARQLRNHGATVSEEERHAGPRPYLLPEFDMLGYNYRMTDLQGAVGLVQIEKLEGFIEERARWATWYRRALAGLDWLATPAEPAGGRHAWQAFVCRVDPDRAPLPRNEIMQRLQARGIATRPGTHAVHMLAYYKERYGFVADDFPGAQDADANSMALPLHNRMSEDDYAYVVEALTGIAG
jgi:dTDP-4-amino-4,6-dideoxygalactose transaminase